jgi:hypothetical protein
MLIEQISGIQGLLEKELKNLALFLEDFPFEHKDSLILCKRFNSNDSVAFHDIFDPIYKLYEQYVSNYGIEKFLKIFKNNCPNQFFILNRNSKIDFNELVNRSILVDAANYFYTVDSFISLPVKEYKTVSRLGLSLDKYNLVQIDNKFDLASQGIVYRKKELLFYHPFLRRYFTSNFTKITRCIADLSCLKNATLRLAIDPLRMNHKESMLGELIELDYWRGPKFNLSKLSDRNFIGCIIYKRLNNGNDLSWPVDRIEVVVKNQSENEKSVTIQEINPSDEILASDNRYMISKDFMNYSKKYRLSKFTHFIWDKRMGCFVHLDIAVIAYKKDDFKKRFDVEFPDKAIVSNVDKIKLVRVDGAITLDIVQGLIGDFFRYNELIYEFFEGE